MATRLYLTNTPADPTSLGEVSGVWNGVGTGATERALGAAPMGAPTSATATENSSTNPFDVRLGRWRYPIYRAGTIQGGFSRCIARDVSNASGNFNTKWSLWVVSHDGTQLRGVLANGTNSSGVWTTTPTANIQTVANLPATVVAQNGDWIVFDPGFRAANSLTTSITGRIYYGGTASPDLADGNTSTNATRPGWIQFEDIDNLLVPEDPPATVLDIGATRSNHFSVQVSRRGDAEPLFVAQADLEAGYDAPPWLTSNVAGTEVTFTAAVDGPVIGTTNARTEAREVTAGGVEQAFNAFVGTHSIENWFQVNHVPAVDQGVVVVQLHNGTADALGIRTQLVTTLRLRARINGSSHATQLASPYTVGTRYSYKIVVHDGGLADFYWTAGGGALPATPQIANQQINPATAGDTFYWKFGCYLQSGTADGEAASDYGEVVHGRPIVIHEAPPDPITIQPAAIPSTATIAAPVLAPGAVTLAPATIASTAAVRTPTITTGPVTLAPAPIPSTVAVAAPTLTPGPVTLAPATIPATSTVGALSLLPGPVLVQPAPIASTAILRPPQLAAGAITLQPQTLAGTSSVGAPTLTVGPVTLTPATITSTAVIGDPTITTGTVLTPATIEPGTTIGAPTLTAGPVTISLVTIPSTTVVGTPGITTATTLITPALIPATAEIQPPTITAGPVTLTPATIPATSTVGSPTLLDLRQIIRPQPIGSEAVVHLPEFTVPGIDYPEPHPGQPIETQGPRAGLPTANDLRAGMPVPL